jgi:hypothetical protein
MRARTRTRIALVACLALASPLAAAAAGSDVTSLAQPVEAGTPRAQLPVGVGLRLLDVRTEQAADPRANIYVVDHVIAGTLVERRLEVSNGTDEPLAISLGGAGASVAEGWLIDESVEDPAPEELAAWIEVDPPNLVLRPQSVATVTARIRVPSGAESGERYGAIVAAPPAVDTGTGIALISRVGVRVYLSVGLGPEPPSDFEIDVLTAARTDESVPTVDVGVVNTGGRALDIAGSIMLVTEDGVIEAGPFEASLGRTVGPGNRGAVRVMLPPDLPRGPWIVTATMRSGLVERVAQATLTFPDAAGQIADAVHAESYERQRSFLIPFAFWLLLLTMLALLATWRLYASEPSRPRPGR